MPAFGFLALLVGALLLRQVAVGRVHNLPEDARDMFTAAINGDMDALKSVLSQRGENVSGPSSSLSGPETLPNLPDGYTTGYPAVLTECVRLGNAAKGYRLGATGPDYYDCSGLIWQACKNLGLYSGPRFTTATFANIINGWATKVEGYPQAGDIVLWRNRHMGVATGTVVDRQYTDKNGDGIDDVTGEIATYSDQMYSARSVSKGIGYSSIEGDSSYFGFSPTYYRIKVR